MARNRKYVHLISSGGGPGMSKFFQHNLTLKLFSIAIAIILWSMSPYNRDPYRDKVFRDVALNVMNEEKLAEKGLILSSDIPDSYSFEVRGRTSNIQGLNEKDINVYLDLSRIKEPGDNRIPVDIRGIPSNIQISQEYYIKLNVDRIVSKTVPVRLEVDEKSQEELAKRYSEVTPKFVEIKGAESIVNKVAYGRVFLSMNEEEDMQLIKQSLPVELMDKDDNPVEVKYIDQNPQFCIATVYPSRTVPIDPLITGKPADGYVVVGSEISPGEVQISGLPEIINSLGTIRTELLDIEGASTDIKRELKLQDYEGVYLSPGEESSVQVLVRVEKITERTIEYEDIKIRNIPSGLKAEIEDTKISMTIRGPYSYVAAIKPDDIEVYVDLQGASKGRKFYSIRTENIPEGVELVNIEPSSVRVSVK